MPALPSIPGLDPLLQRRPTRPTAATLTPCERCRPFLPQRAAPRCSFSTPSEPARSPSSCDPTLDKKMNMQLDKKIAQRTLWEHKAISIVLTVMHMRTGMRQRDLGPLI